MRESNIYLENQQGQGFIDKTDHSNMTDFMTTETNGMVDIDNDGDLDVLTVSSEGPLMVYINQTDENNAIVFELYDEQGNHFGVGSKVIIRYGGEVERHQIREIKLGGGHLAYEPPVAHFGLGQYQIVDSVEIDWPTGERTVLKGEFKVGNRYRITRNAGSTDS